MKRLLFLILLSIGLLALPRLRQSVFQTGDRRTDYEVEGIDVSRYQSDIDWDAIYEDDFEFAFMKATEGQELVDEYYERNWRAAGKSGLRRGAYHFFRPEVSPTIQAQHFFNQVELDMGDLPPVLDVEVRGELSVEELVIAVTNWLELAEARYGLRPILYTGQKFYNRYLAGRFDDYPLWLARYASREPVPACGREYQFWQYDQEGRADGIEGHVDLNIFNGTLEELDALCTPVGEPSELEVRYAKEK
ncbi:MAG: GH25 family lysozyme [Bacteroidota bacterium]